MELNESKQLSWSEAEKSSAADILHKTLLEQMECLCRTVQNMGDRMEGTIAHEGLRRQQDNQKLKEEMCVRMDEGFKNEECAGKLVLRCLNCSWCSPSINIAMFPVPSYRTVRR